MKTIALYDDVHMLCQERKDATSAGRVTAEQLASVVPVYQAMAKHIVDFPFSVSTGRLPVTEQGNE